MLDQMASLRERFVLIERELEDPAIMQDSKRYPKLHREHKKLQEILEQADFVQKLKEQWQDNKQLLQDEKDPDLLAMAKEERVELEEQICQAEEKLKELLLPKDPHDDKNVILELRAGTGGDEAAIWAGDLFRMYQRFSEEKRWKIDVLSATEGASGGYKEIIATITGEDVYKMLKYESGVHRVQRVPATETQGRIHTSAASVVVLPEMDEIDVEIDMNEIRKDTFCSSGPGGQSVNTTYSAVRLTHLPTGITVSCQDGKSQIKNFEKALKVMRARLHEKAMKEQQEAVGKERKSMVGSGDRSEKIRTYNYPQGRVTDHRIHFTQHNLPQVLAGDLEKLIEALRLAENTKKMASADLSQPTS